MSRSTKNIDARHAMHRTKSLIAQNLNRLILSFLFFYDFYHQNRKTGGPLYALTLLKISEKTACRCAQNRCLPGNLLDLTKHSQATEVNKVKISMFATTKSTKAKGAGD